MIRNLSDNIGDCWLKNQSNTYDREVAESMRFRRWIDIKTCMKQNVYFQEKKRGDIRVRIFEVKERLKYLNRTRDETIVKIDQSNAYLEQ